MATLAGLIAVVVALLLVDLLLFARNREPSFREAATWSAGWFVLSLAVAPLILLVKDGPAAVDYTTVYLIERSLSLDNLFVFLLLFAYFRVPQPRRPALLFWGIVLALVLRGLAIVGGTALIDRFHVVIYILGATLLVLAWRMFRGVEEQADPESTLAVRLARRAASRGRRAAAAGRGRHAPAPARVARGLFFDCFSPTSRSPSTRSPRR